MQLERQRSLRTGLNSARQNNSFVGGSSVEGFDVVDCTKGRSRHVSRDVGGQVLRSYFELGQLLFLVTSQFFFISADQIQDLLGKWVFSDEARFAFFNFDWLKLLLQPVNGATPPFKLRRILGQHPVRPALEASSTCCRLHMLMRDVSTVDSGTNTVLPSSLSG